MVAMPFEPGYQTASGCLSRRSEMTAEAEELTPARVVRYCAPCLPFKVLKHIAATPGVSIRIGGHLERRASVESGNLREQASKGRADLDVQPMGVGTKRSPQARGGVFETELSAPVVINDS